MHRIGGLEKDYLTGVISLIPRTIRMVNTRKAKIEKIDFIPEQEVIGSSDADTLIVGWGGTYGHLLEAMMRIQDKGKRVALAHFRFISPLPRNTYDILKRYKKIIVAEQNTGHFASYLSGQFNDLKIDRPVEPSALASW